MRSTYDWSSQGGKLPRCVLPRTGETAVTRALRCTPLGTSQGYSRQGSRQKAAQTSSVAERLTAVQPAPQGAAERAPGHLTGATAGRSERGVSLGAAGGPASSQKPV